MAGGDVLFIPGGIIADYHCQTILILFIQLKYLSNKADMKKIMNDPVNFVDEMLKGILIAHPHQLSTTAGDLRCIIKAGAGKKNKVGIATGGGSGHLPLFLGYVGDGLLDGCAVGGVFQSPSSDQMLEVTRAINQGAGVLYIYGNYGGDIMNFDMAGEM